MTEDHADLINQAWDEKSNTERVKQTTDVLWSSRVSSQWNQYGHIVSDVWCRFVIEIQHEACFETETWAPTGHQSTLAAYVELSPVPCPSTIETPSSQRLSQRRETPTPRPSKDRSPF